MNRMLVVLAAAGFVYAGFAVSAHAQTTPSNPPAAKAEPLGLFPPGKSGWGTGKFGTTPATYFSGYRKAGTLTVPAEHQTAPAPEKK